MAIKTDVQLSTDANVIKNETVAGANTANRIGTLLSDLSDSKINVSSASGGLFAALATNAWDFTTGIKKSKTLSANTAITISGNVAGQSVALLSVTQDATGSRTLSLNGTNLVINTAANSNTLISIIDLGGGLFAFDTNLGVASGTVGTGGTGGGTSTETPITFGFFTGGLSAAGTVITSTTGAFADNQARAATLKLTGDGYVVFEIPTTNEVDTILGFNTANANIFYGGMVFFIWVSSNTSMYQTGFAGGNIFSTGVVRQIGDRVRLIRTAGVVLAQYFRGGIWTTLPFNGTTSSITADLFITIDASSPSRISNISGFNLTTI